MEGSKIVDAVGCFRGNSIQQADAQQAYVQSDLGGDVQTFVEIPPEFRPKKWKGFRRPVCLLVKALYGHPDSGTFWEQHCDSRLKKIGFKKVTDWDSLYHHPGYKCTLMVYVDDFKLAGPEGNLGHVWHGIKKVLDLDNPKPVDRCLGCRHMVTTEVRGSEKVKVMHWDMREFLSQCVDSYCERARTQRATLKKVKTPSYRIRSSG